MDIAINRLIENWQFLRQRVNEAEYLFASQCLHILSDIASDLFMVVTLNMEAGQYLKLQQDYNMPAVQNPKEYRIRMETPAINLRIMTVLYVHYRMEGSKTWHAEWEKKMNQDLLPYIKEAYDGYLWIIENAKQTDGGAELLEILYNYNHVRKYAEAIYQKLQSSGFIRSDIVRDMQYLYAKALRIEVAKEATRPCEKEEHDFYTYLLKMNLDAYNPSESKA